MGLLQNRRSLFPLWLSTTHTTAALSQIHHHSPDRFHGIEEQAESQSARAEAEQAEEEDLCSSFTRVKFVVVIREGGVSLLPVTVNPPACCWSSERSRAQPPTSPPTPQATLLKRRHEEHASRALCWRPSALVLSGPAGLA